MALRLLLALLLTLPFVTACGDESTGPEPSREEPAPSPDEDASLTPPVTPPADATDGQDATPDQDTAPESDATPNQDVEPEPDVVPDPDATPEPDVVPDPDVTPEPDVVPDPDATPEPDVTPEPGNGACDNAADLAALEENQDEIQGALSSCAQSCINQGVSCHDPCIQPRLGTSSGCTRCFSEAAICTVSNCILQCIGGGTPACTNCIRNSCATPFETCSGVDFPQ